MSSYYDIMLIGKKDGVFKNINLYFNKEILSGWELPFNYLQGCEEEYEEYFESATAFDYMEYRGCYKFDLIEKIPRSIWLSMGHLIAYKNVPSSKAEVYSITMKDWASMVKGMALDEYEINPNDAGPKDIMIVTGQRLCRPADKGMWFTLSDLEAEIEKTYNELKSNLQRMGEWLFISNSLDYKKLPRAEKNNIQSTYGDILNCYQEKDGEITHYDEETQEEYLIEKYNGLVGMKELYKSFAFDNDDVWGCVYNTDCTKEVC